VLSRLILVSRQRHVARIAEDVNELEHFELTLQKWQQINCSWRFATPSRPASFRGRHMTRQCCVKIFFHPRHLPRRHWLPANFGGNVRVDPFFVKVVKLECVTS